MIDVMPRARPSRRDALRVTALGLAAVTVGGCSGERLRTPWSPEPPEDGEARTLPPDTDLLEAALERVDRYRGLLERADPTSDGQRDRIALLGDLWGVQQERVGALLRLSGVEAGASATTGPASEVDAAATSAPDGAGSTRGPTLELADLGREVRSSVDTSVAEVARSTATNRPMLTSLAAQHAVSAALLGAAVEWPELAGPTGSAAVPVLGATRPAVFGLEVVAARSLGDERERYEAVLGPLRALNRTLTTLAGDAARSPRSATTSPSR